MQFPQILVCCMTNISNLFLTQCWTLETSSRPFYFLKITIKRDQAIFNNWHLAFLIVPYSPFQKIKHWNLDIIGIEYLEQVAKLIRTWFLGPVLQIVQRIPENYCLCLYLSVSQIWWLNELWFKRYIQKWTLSHEHCLMGWLKLQKLEYLENRTKISYGIKNSYSVPQMTTFEKLSFVAEVTFKDSLALLLCYGWMFSDVKSFKLLAHCLRWKPKLYTQEGYIKIASAGVLATRKTSFFKSDLSS